MLTLAFLAILSAHSMVVLSPGMGISAVTSFATSSALIDASRSFITNGCSGYSECEREGTLAWCLRVFKWEYKDNRGHERLAWEERYIRAREMMPQIPGTRTRTQAVPRFCLG